MAEYDYICRDCGERWIISSSPKNIFGMRKFCPQCYSENVRRVFKPLSVIYKGSGFYSTDKDKK